MPPVEFEPTISAGERPQAAHLLRSWVLIPPGAWIFFCCKCRLLSGRGLCDELITRPEESYRLWCVVVYDLETSRIGAPYIYDISNLRVKTSLMIYASHQTRDHVTENEMGGACIRALNSFTQHRISTLFIELSVRE